MADRAHTLADRVARTTFRALTRLPAPGKRAIAGRPLRLDGQELHVDVQMGLRLLGLTVSKTFEELPLAEGRAQIASEAWVFGDEIPLETIEDVVIPGSETSIAARVYRPAGLRRPSAGLVYFHGGGWVLGDLSASDSVARFIAHHARVTVVAVDYRLAPEHPFPAGLTDAIDAFTYVATHPADFGVDPRRLAVGGESAGGNFAAVVSLETARQARTTPRPTPSFQLLFMPVTDLSTRHRSYELFGEGFFLTARQMDWYQQHYLDDPDLVKDSRVSPLLADDLHDVPPAYVVVAGFDVLRDEGEAYAHKLIAADVRVALRRHSGATHSLVNATGVGTAARHMLLEACGALTVGLAENADES